MPKQLNDVTASYYRCRRDDGFLDTFYEVFLSKSELIAAKFANTDFRLQKLMLRQSLLEMICFDLGMEGTREEIDRLGVTHREMEISTAMYDMWLDALCEAVQKHDPEYSERLEELWRESMRRTIQEMITASGADRNFKD